MNRIIRNSVYMVKYIVLSNEQQWCTNCWKAAVDNDRVRFIESQLPFDKSSKLYNIAFRHIRFKSRSAVLLPFVSIWHRSFDEYLKIDNNVKTVLIVYDWNSLTKDLGFFTYLKRRHKNLSIVYMFSNIVAISGAKYYKIIEKLNNVFDVVYAFDREDVKKYNFEYSPLIYTTDVQMPPISEAMENDLFYLGMAKDRYDALIELFEKATAEGLKCDFTIVGVPEEKRKHQDVIKYTPVSYDTAIKGMAKAKCIVDIIQGNSTGLTIKNCEALAFGRKLITSNPHVRDVEFYHPENICVYGAGISIKGFIETPFVAYKEIEKAYFSPKTLFEKTERLLKLNQ